VLIIDLGSKFLILQNFALGETVSLFPSLNLHYARNYGAAFSFLADSGGWQRWFFAGIAIGICVILAVLMYRSKATQKLNNIAYALIIGGALGNLFDRLWHGFVVDMIDFYVGDWHFATFNLADSAICIGAALIVLEGFLPKPLQKSRRKCQCRVALRLPGLQNLCSRRPGKRSATGQTGGPKQASNLHV
jgi:signal peptidase II